jgi:hypothetical protein
VLVIPLTGQELSDIVIKQRFEDNACLIENNCKKSGGYQVILDRMIKAMDVK